MIVHYAESKKLKIIPKYQGLSIDGFDVVNKKTDEVVSHTKMLCEAEQIVLSDKPLTGKITFGSAAEIEHY